MTHFLDLAALLRVARRACRGPVEVRDAGLLESALARPRAAVLGQDAYPDIHTKAAALLHSLVLSHALVEGNKRLGWLAPVVFLWINGWDVRAPDDDAFDLVMAVASGHLDDVQKIAQRLREWSVARSLRV